jgi:hypothetical protein
VNVLIDLGVYQFFGEFVWLLFPGVGLDQTLVLGFHVKIALLYLIMIKNMIAIKVLNHAR